MHNHVDNPFESPSIISLCSGMLGLEEGIHRVLAGCRTIVHVEIESFVIENLVQQMEKGVLAPTPIWSNLKTFPFPDFYRKTHWLVGGYPCQPFSHAGLRGGTEDPRHLYPFISRGIKKSRPVGVFFENVEGHLSLGLRDVCKDLRKLGYQVEVGLYSAAEVGAPHRRNRVFILGLENAFLIRMRGWSDEQRAYWRRQIQTPRPSELGDAGCFVGQSATERGMDLERNALAEGRRNESSNLTETPNGALGDPEYPGSQREDAIQKSRKPTQSGLLELSGLADADDNGQQQFERIFGEIRERAGHGSEAMGNAAIEHAGSRTREDGQVESGRSGMANTDIHADQSERGNDEESRGLSEEKSQSGHGAPLSGGSGDDNGLANAAVIGMERDWPEGVGVTEISTGEAISGCDGGGDRWEDTAKSEGELRLRSQLDNNGGQIPVGEMSEVQNAQVGISDFHGWPARPGEPQYDWEASRLESSLGYAVNGYNYREDLLRMAGNAVVRQQSEKAFRTLLLKFIK